MLNSSSGYIPRKLEAILLKYLPSPEIVAVVGPRQGGKTTLLHHIYKTLKDKAIFLTFEDKKVLDIFVHHPDEFAGLYLKPYQFVFIDEFQYARQGGKILKYLIDTQPRKIFISGSSSVDLTVQTVKYLVGRIFVFSLFPLDFEEFLSYRDPNLLPLYREHKIGLPPANLKSPLLSEISLEKLRQYFQEYALFGGYPRVVTSSTPEEKKVVLKNIYNTYFLREVKDILGLVDDYKLSQMLKALALQIGNLIEYQGITNISELSFPTVKGYLNFLGKTFICTLVKPYFRNKRTELVKSPKVYFFDTGLRNYVVDDFRKLEDRPDGGALLENAFAMELIKQEIPFHYWRSKKQAEVDFILDLPGNQKLALEVKESSRPSDWQAKSVLEFKKHHSEVPLFFGVLSGQTDPQGKIVPLVLL